MAVNGCEIGRKRCCLQQQQVRERDRISELPNEILEEILSVIPDTKDVVKTSILSKRWKSVWTSVRVVRIRERELFANWPLYPTMYHKQKEASFVNFIENFFNRVKSLRTLELSCKRVYVKQWIDIVTNKLDDHAASLHELDLTLFMGHLHLVKLPHSIFTNKNLVILKLGFVVEQLTSLPSQSSSIPSIVVHLPCLKVFHLTTHPAECWMDGCLVQNILTGCPILEELHLSGVMYNKHSTRLCLKLSTLKRLKLCLDYNSTIEINASDLEELDFNLQHQIVIVNTTRPLIMRVTPVMSPYWSIQPQILVYGNRLLELLTKASNIQYLSLSSCVVACLEKGGFYHQVAAKFNSLMGLNLDVCVYGGCHTLPWFLESSPNLVSISIRRVKNFIPKMDLLQCEDTHNYSMMVGRLYHLEKIELKDFKEFDYEMNLVRYLLKKAPVLKEMIFSFPARKSEVTSRLRRKILRLPKASTACKVTGL